MNVATKPWDADTTPHPRANIGTSGTLARSIDDILQTAAALFAERGYDGVSFRDLTEATGAKRSLLLYHFGSKDELWRRAMLDIVRRFNEAFSAQSPQMDDVPDERKVPIVLRSFIDALTLVPQYGQVLIREGVKSGDRLDWLVKNFVPPFAAHMSRLGPGPLAKVRSTMVRDLVIAAPLFATALGPLLEASTAAASHIDRAGIYPLSPQRRDELVEILARLILT